MRTLAKNKRKMYYSLYEDAQTVYSDKKIMVDGEEVAVEIGTTKAGYKAPVAFKGNISMSGGEITETQYGLDVSNYSAILVMNKGEIPLDEHSLIWFESEPQLKGEGADPSTADYKVVKVNPSLNVDKFLLQRIEK